MLAVREREKGNEAFRAGDYAEALQLYGASIALDCDILAYNNRAMTRECFTLLEILLSIYSKFYYQKESLVIVSTF